jgi:geranylgeranylglycerol-phosphate geranylgeranyltransferase
MYLTALAAYIYNDITDVKADSVNSSNRPLVSGMVSGKEALVLSFVLGSAAIVLASSINIYAAIFVAICLALGVIYSHPKTNFKEKFPHKTIINSAGAGLAAIFGGVVVEGISLYLLYAAGVAVTFLWILAPLGDIQDLRGDKLAGKRTLPLVIGVLPTVIIMLAIVPAIAITTLILQESIGMNMLSLFMILGLSVGSVYVLRPLISKWNNELFMKMTRHKMRFIYLLLQLSLVIGLLQF